ncbi:ParB N-terminal domain-containing protein, partial [Streptococcus agalactiae]|nr:ParB N-terminal domain-containing protein [Streptococcus agalactiae]
EYVDIDSIKPYQKNARLNDGDAVEKVAASIKEFGFQQPILVDENNVIITGHTRLKAAKSLGIDKIPISHAIGLTDEQIKAYRLADNRVAEFSMWDFDLLESEIEELTTIDMSKFGFDLSIDDLAIDANYIEIEEDEEITDKKEHHRDLT